MIDSHCHLADQAFADDLDEVVRRARDAGVSGGLCVLALGSPSEAVQAARVRRLWPEFRYAVGVHPHEAREWAGRTGELSVALRDQLAASPDARAVGEIGLDYHYDLSPRDAQREVFRCQARLARDAGLPVVVHTREADEDTVSILREEGGGRLRGVFHCFSGTSALARQALELGFLLSFSGMVTFPRAAGIRAVAAEVPGGRLLVETDCPYLAPAPHRGKRNEPAWVVRTAAAIADLRGVGLSDLDARLTENFADLFAP